MNADKITGPPQRRSELAAALAIVACAAATLLVVIMGQVPPHLRVQFSDETVKNIAISFPTRTLVAAGHHTITVHDNGNLANIQKISSKSVVRCIACFSTLPIVAVSGWRAIEVFDLRSRALIVHVPCPDGSVMYGPTAFSPSGNEFAASFDERRILIYDVVSKSTLNKEVFAASRIDALCYSPDGQSLVCGTQGGVEIFKFAELGGWTSSLYTVTGSVQAIAINPSSNLLAVASGSSKLSIWRLPSMSEIGDLVVGDRINSLAFSRDDSVVVSFGELGAYFNTNGGVRVVHLGATPSASLAFSYRTPLLSLAILPDGRIVSGSSDGSLCVSRPGCSSP